MSEAKNKFYLKEGQILSVDQYEVENSNKGNIIYEVLRVTDGAPIFLKEHILRMEKSCALVEKKLPYTFDKIKSFVNKVIEANDNVEGNIKITYDIINKTIKVFYINHSYPTEAQYKNGVKTILYHGERTNPNAKIVNNSFREKVTEEINKANAFEAILVDRNGGITEGSKSNIFFVIDNKLVTAAAGAVLKGVTRSKIIEGAKAIGIEVEEREVKYTDLSSVQGLFISGTSPKALPISEVDGQKFDVNNNIIRSVMAKYDELVQAYLVGYKEF